MSRHARPLTASPQHDVHHAGAAGLAAAEDAARVALRARAAAMISSRLPPFRKLRHAAQAALLAIALAQPAAAADPLTLKDLLSRAQTEAETKAVNDLIDKLQGSARPKPPAGGAPVAPPATAPVESPPAASAAAPPPPPTEAQGSARAAPPEPNAPPASIAAPAPQVSPQVPDAAIAAAESQRLPSVDLEVLFDYNSDAIAEDALPTLKTLGQALSDPRLAADNFLIGGHTDAKGGPRFNLDLSRRRAEAVRRFLVANFRIDAKRLVAKGFGLAHLKNRSQPLAAENRRVQVVNLSRNQQP